MTKTTNILNGKEIAAKHLERLSSVLAECRRGRGGSALRLATVQVGDSHDTALYAKAITNLLGKLNISHDPVKFQETIGLADLQKQLKKINADPQVTGIMIFAPLPKHIKPDELLGCISEAKDVEGRRWPSSMSKAGNVMPPTALSAVTLVQETGVAVEGKECLIIGRSDVVGKPAFSLMLEKNATVTLAHSKTKNLKAHVEQADILIVSMGKPEFIKGDWIKPGAVVIDVGENVVNGKLVGDVEFEKAKERAAFISPVPGGVGPLTNVMLVQNLISLYGLQGQ